MTNGAVMFAYYASGGKIVMVCSSLVEITEKLIDLIKSHRPQRRIIHVTVYVFTSDTSYKDKYILIWKCQRSR